VVAPSSSTETKLNAYAQLQTFLYPMASKPFPYSSALMVKSAQTLMLSSVMDKQGERHQPFSFPGSAQSHSPTIYGTMIE